MRRRKRFFLSCLMTALASCVALGMMAAENVFAQPGAAGMRLQVLADFTPQGMVLREVDPNGPAAHVIDPATGAEGALEPGDLIVQIDGRPIRSGDDYFRAMDATAARGGVLAMLVRDVRTGQLIRRDTRAVQIQQVARPIIPNPPLINPNVPPFGPNGRRATRVQVLLIGLTADQTIGESIKVNLRRLGSVLTDTPGIQPNDIRYLAGPNLSAQSVMDFIRQTEVRESEALFCYYAGHGAFDPQLAGPDDPSGGHYFQIPNGDLARRDVANQLLDKRARLTVLITDTCNVQAQFQQRAPQNAPAFGEGIKQIGNQGLARLLFGHVGFVDVSGTSRGQYGWSSPDIGGWFTDALVQSFESNQVRNNPNVTWNNVMQLSGPRTEAIYQARRQRVLGQPGAAPLNIVEMFRQQATQSPTAFVFNVRADN